MSPEPRYFDHNPTILCQLAQRIPPRCLPFFNYCNDIVGWGYVAQRFNTRPLSFS